MRRMPPVAGIVDSALAQFRVLCSLLGIDAGVPGDIPLRPDRWHELVGWYRPDPGPLTNVRTLALGHGAEVVVRRRALLLRGFSPVPALWRGTPLRPVDDREHVFAVDLQSIGMPPLEVHFEPANGTNPWSLHLGGLVTGAMPALRRARQATNPRRVAAAGAGAAALAVARRRRAG
jgi:hypothetical protein